MNASYPALGIMAKGMATRWLRHSGQTHRVMDRVLEDALVQMVPATLAGRCFDVGPGGGEDPLPGPLAARRRVLCGQGAGQLDPTGAGLDVAGVKPVGTREVLSQGLAQHLREKGGTILVALAGSHDDAGCVEVDVLHAQPFGDPAEKRWAVAGALLANGVDAVRGRQLSRR